MQYRLDETLQNCQQTIVYEFVFVFVLNIGLTCVNHVVLELSGKVCQQYKVVACELLCR